MTAHASRLRSIVERFADRRVAVIGDLVVDEFVYGDIARVSREAPVLILDHRETVIVPGGGGNAIANLRALGARPIPVGVVGKDTAGDRLIEYFDHLGIRTTHVARLARYHTPTKSRILAGGIHTRRQQVVRVDRGARPDALGERVRSGIARRARAAAARAEGLVIADYGYGAAAPECALAAARDVCARGLPALVDSRGRVGRFEGLTASTPNQEELELAVGHAVRDAAELERAGKTVLKRTRQRGVLVTRGARGMTLFERGRSPHAIPAFGSDEVADVTGAGDTVIATFALALVAGATMPEAALLANAAAGLVVQKAGTATIGPPELLGAIDELTA